MEHTDNESKAAGAPSALNVGLGLPDRISAHLRQLAPHQKERDGVVLLAEARDEIEHLRGILAEVGVQFADGTPPDKWCTGWLMDQLRDNGFLNAQRRGKGQAA